MTLCPIALAVSCTRCPAFKICPATRLLGDQKTVSSASLMRSSPLTQSLKKAVKKGAKPSEAQTTSPKPKTVAAAKPVAQPAPKSPTANAPKFTRKKSK
jgi:hypothetical protein